MRHVVYLHGFASSALSTKAGYFRERWQGRGVTVHSPDFNAPDFRTLTMTRMLAQLAEVCAGLDDGPVALVGSSLGGTLAILAAGPLAPVVDRLVLLAPAVMFARPGHHLLAPERIAEWQAKGALPFFHYGHGDERLLDYAFCEDAGRYDAFAAPVPQPTIIFQGRHDTVVDPATVEAFARDRANVSLTLLDDGHQLVDSLPAIAVAMEPFLGVLP